MRIINVCAIAILSVMGVMGCAKNVLSTANSPDVKVEALVATPTVVPAGGRATLVCNAKSAKGMKLSYLWQATGAYGQLIPNDSVCIFMSPSCHSGLATVTVTVTDENGASTQGSVDLNK